MAEKISVMVLVGMFLFALIVKRIKGLPRRERWVLLLYVIPIGYLCVMYATGNDWPNLHDLADVSVGEHAKIIVGWLKKQP
jgi:predicted permease